MKKMHFLLTVSMLLTAPAFAQDDLVPATSEDIQSFDDQVADSDVVTDAPTKERKENFGSAVSAEARKLKDMSPEERKKMGQWVSEQRRKDADKRPAGVANGAAAGAGSTMGGSSDARASAPAHNDVGTSPGQGGPGTGNSNRPNRGR